ncbi:MAG: hypothetical protein U0K37_03150 [Acutalibacteraceae bacterium]|nr:hypothetical protein [Acutalibacteraceae bacterium]
MTTFLLIENVVKKGLLHSPKIANATKEFGRFSPLSLLQSPFFPNAAIDTIEIEHHVALFLCCNKKNWKCSEEKRIILLHRPKTQDAAKEKGQDNESFRPGP